MASNVFGNPVTKLTLEAMLEYEGKEITRFHLAREAYNMKNAEHKAVNARAYVDNLKANFGDGVCTKCLIYNATGEPITFLRAHNWHGRIGESPFPMVIANGQWGAFLHTKTPVAAAGSSGAVVYRMKHFYESQEIDCMACWDTAWGPTENRCYVEIDNTGHFDNINWDAVETKMSNSGLQCVVRASYFKAALSIGNDTTSEWECILTVWDPETQDYY